MNRYTQLVLLLAGTAFTLTGCASPSDPEQMTVRCEGPDKLFILDDPNKGSELFVVPAHPDCKS